MLCGKSPSRTQLAALLLLEKETVGNENINEWKEISLIAVIKMASPDGNENRKEWKEISFTAMIKTKSPDGNENRKEWKEI